jgi:hypothetical protein
LFENQHKYFGRSNCMFPTQISQDPEHITTHNMQFTYIIP